MHKLTAFIKKEIVLVIALSLALASMCVVPPDGEYAEYIDFRTLSILFCLMIVMAGFQEAGVFRRIAEALLGRVGKAWQLVLILVLLCFFFSMLITNDVALITFVPFTFIVLELLGQEAERRLILPVVVLQTIAANLGSMLTPIGNPQNLYLYGKAGLSVGAFILLMLPYCAAALVLLTVCCVCLGRKNAGNQVQVSFDRQTELKGKAFPICRGLLLFVLCLLTVARVLPYGITLILVLVVTCVFDRRLLRKADYSLLLTFVGFFVFIGNMGRIPAFSTFLQHIISGHEVITAVAASQIISNVPAALLLSGFTEDYAGLILGTNLGGLGTLIASMASLISYKYIARSGKCSKGRYLAYFTAANLIFLALLLGLWKI